MGEKQMSESQQSPKDIFMTEILAAILKFQGWTGVSVIKIEVNREYMVGTGKQYHQGEITGLNLDLK